MEMTMPVHGENRRDNMVISRGEMSVLQELRKLIQDKGYLKEGEFLAQVLNAQHLLFSINTGNEKTVFLLFLWLINLLTLSTQCVRQGHEMCAGGNHFQFLY
jgi:hypothetical protein